MYSSFIPSSHLFLAEPPRCSPITALMQLFVLLRHVDRRDPVRLVLVHVLCDPCKLIDARSYLQSTPNSRDSAGFLGLKHRNHRHKLLSDTLCALLAHTGDPRPIIYHCRCDPRAIPDVCGNAHYHLSVWLWGFLRARTRDACVVLVDAIHQFHELHLPDRPLRDDYSCRRGSRFHVLGTNRCDLPERRCQFVCQWICICRDCSPNLWGGHTSLGLRHSVNWLALCPSHSRVCSPLGQVRRASSQGRARPHRWRGWRG